jgi:hypothetical protein
MGRTAGPYAKLHHHRAAVSGFQSRAGTHQRQPAGYRAFIPAPLPPAPPVQIAGDMQRLLSQADLALGRLDGSIQTLPNPDLFVLMYVRKEAVLSSQIEGTQSSLQDLLAAEAQLYTPETPKDVEEVVVSVNEVRDVTGTSYPAANQLIERLVKIGIPDRNHRPIA